MKESKHTPGPWAISPTVLRFMEANITADHKGGKLSIAHVDSVDGFSGDSKANARLIAAAPDLLAACKSVLDDFDAGGDKTGFRESIIMLRSAIAKATGS